MSRSDTKPAPGNRPPGESGGTMAGARAGTGEMSTADSMPSSSPRSMHRMRLVTAWVVIALKMDTSIVCAIPLSTGAAE
eukprot:348014-Pleurochrysis_carterae.AAC.2